MRAGQTLRTVAAIALALAALAATVVFLAMPAGKYDWMRDFGEASPPADPDKVMRLVMFAAPATLAWLVAGWAFRSAGHDRASGTAFLAAALLAAATLYRLA